MAKTKAKAASKPAAKSKEKRNWKHIHKIRVHDNRWLVWTIAICVLVCSTLVAYIQVTGIDFDTQMGYAPESTMTWSSFNNSSDGYSFKYPRSWGVESEGPATMSFVNPANPNEYFSVITYPVEQERQVRSSLVATGTEQPVMVAGLSGTRFVQNTDKTENVVLVNEGENVYVLRGKGGTFEKIIESFRFKQKIE